MKRFSKLLVLIVTLVLLFNLASCAPSHADANKETVEAHTVLDLSTEKETFVGYYHFDEETKTGILYLVGSEVPAGEYELVYINTAAKVDKNKTYSFPSHGHGRDGYQFAGWYPTAEFKNGEKLTTNTALVDADNVIYAKYITIADSGIVSVVSILIVFAMLALLWGIVSLFKYIPTKGEQPKQEPAKAPVVSAGPKKTFTIEDIKDEDMMVAALIATIDYHNETNEDVRVVSVKQIG